jgi:predicted signal transduction protein with EAL and GGDEF domain
MKFEVKHFEGRKRAAWRVSAKLEDPTLIKHFGGTEISVRTDAKDEKAALAEGQHRIEESIRRYHAAQEVRVRPGMGMKAGASGKA